MKIKAVFLLTGLMAVWLPGAALADAGTKFGRGLANAGLGWFEIINEIGNESDRHGPFIGFPSGLIRGSAFALVRTLAGVYEIVTFPLPNGSKKGYGPLVLPENPFDRR